MKTSGPQTGKGAGECHETDVPCELVWRKGGRKGGRKREGEGGGGKRMNGVEEGERIQIRCVAIHGLLPMTKRVDEILKTSQPPMLIIPPL